MFLQVVRESWYFQVVQTQSCEQRATSGNREVGYFQLFQLQFYTHASENAEEKPQTNASFIARYQKCFCKRLCSGSLFSEPPQSSEITQNGKLGSCLGWPQCPVEDCGQSLHSSVSRMWEGQGDSSQEDIKETSENPCETTFETRYHMDVTTV